MVTSMLHGYMGHGVCVVLAAPPNCHEHALPNTPTTACMWAILWYKRVSCSVFMRLVVLLFRLMRWCPPPASCVCSRVCGGCKPMTAICMIPRRRHA